MSTVDITSETLPDGPPPPLKKEFDPMEIFRNESAVVASKLQEALQISKSSPGPNKRLSALQNAYTYSEGWIYDDSEFPDVLKRYDPGFMRSLQPDELMEFVGTLTQLRKLQHECRDDMRQLMWM